MTHAVLAKHACLAKLPVVRDITIAKAPQLATRDSAWRWAIDTLLPKASNRTVYNLYHFDLQGCLHDPQSNATLGNLDYAIQQKAFVSDLMPNVPADAALLAEIFAKLVPLFDAYGWAQYEEAWTMAVSVAGGTVFCSFASPNLSFWARLPLVPEAKGKARRLPSGDSGKLLDNSKYVIPWRPFIVQWGTSRRCACAPAEPEAGRGGLAGTGSQSQENNTFPNLCVISLFQVLRHVPDQRG